MARLIPNQKTKVYYTATIANIASPTVAEVVTAGKDLTAYVISINATTRGNIVATPDFSSRFETSIPGTVSSTFEADFYRDNASGASGDLAWITLPRDTAGYIVISRFGGSGANGVVAATDKVEVWPITVMTRAAQNLTNNTAQTFMIQCAVTAVPNEAAVMA